MTSRPGTRITTTTVLSVVLAVAITAAAILLAIQLRPDAPIRFGLGEPQGTDCPQGVGAPACFRVMLTNLGNRPSGVRCQVFAPAGAEAAFLNQSVIYESVAPIQPGGVLELIAKVTAGTGGTASAPTFSCTAR
jgi:hypothetical protein